MYRVIIADDVPEYLSLLRNIFDDSGEFDVVGEASNGIEAIELAEKLAPDLVIADIDMPELDGLDLAHAISDRMTDMKVILTSSHEDSSYERLAKEEGALAFIPKAKFSTEFLIQVLQQVE